MFLGIDLGTSAVKAVLTDEAGAVLEQSGAALRLSTPQALWSEQDPEDWWLAVDSAVSTLGTRRDLSAVRAIGLAGQMHGAVLLDRGDAVLRPAILWNDGRSWQECRAFEARESRSRAISGNRAMPGFTAPKLLWVREHEPEIFARIRRVLLPKDWLRLRLTGEAVSDMSDASGTLWLDVAARRWSAALLAASALEIGAMPRLVEGSAVGGALRADIAARWGMRPGCPLAGGASDNAAGAVGIGCVADGRSFVSLGTSGVVFVADARFRPDPDRAVHGFCHALPGLWHRMAVILSAAASLSWLARIAGGPDEGALLSELAAQGLVARNRVVFLPYLAGERTPHDDAQATGVFFGLSSDTTRADMTRAVLEGVAFALADGMACLEAAGTRVEPPIVIGGGARSRDWLRILAAALGRPVLTAAEGSGSPALGAARLAQLAIGAASLERACAPPSQIEMIAPEPELVETMARRAATFRALYPDLRARFAAGA